MAEMTHDVNERDFAVLRCDRYTFAVLSRILHGACELILTDHEKVLLCHSEHSYPVWLWTADGMTEADKERAWQIAEANRPLAAGYRYNMKYEMAAYFMQKAGEQGIKAGIATRMFAYDCPSPIRPDCAADGMLYCCREEDAAEAANLMAAFHAELGDERQDTAHFLARVREYIDGQAFFFWKNVSGETVACCSSRVSDEMASIGCVYTLPERRRRHYAQHMVYQVTKRAAERGLTPMLYTDADYAPSNACYEKIGYILRGGLCTIQKQND